MTAALYLMHSGKDTPLYNRPETEDQITHLAEPINVPMPISRRVLDRYLDTYYGVAAQKSDGENAKQRVYYFSIRTKNQLYLLRPARQLEARRTTTF